jgi:hypothetical protein
MIHIAKRQMQPVDFAPPRIFREAAAKTPPLSINRSLGERQTAGDLPRAVRKKKIVLRAPPLLSLISPLS